MHQVEVVSGLPDLVDGDTPRIRPVLPVTPPLEQRCELSELKRLRFCVVLAPDGEGMRVIPNLRCRSCPVKEQNVGRYRGIRGEYAVRQPNDGVEVGVIEEGLLDSRRNAVKRQRTG